MSAGNAGAAIGLANTNKVGPIGAYVQDAGVMLGGQAGNPGPSASDAFCGTNGTMIYDRNVLDELVNPAFTVRGNSGAAEGKLAQWVTNTAIIAAGTTRVDVSGVGVATANNSTGAFDVWCTPVAGIPANSFFWAFTR
jgi:hypothetical protein